MKHRLYLRVTHRENYPVACIRILARKLLTQEDVTHFTLTISDVLRAASLVIYVLEVDTPLWGWIALPPASQ